MLGRQCWHFSFSKNRCPFFQFQPGSEMFTVGLNHADAQFRIVLQTIQCLRQLEEAVRVQRVHFFWPVKGNGQNMLAAVDQNFFAHMITYPFFIMSDTHHMDTVSHALTRRESFPGGSCAPSMAHTVSSVKHGIPV